MPQGNPLGIANELTAVSELYKLLNRQYQKYVPSDVRRNISDFLDAPTPGLAIGATDDALRGVSKFVDNLDSLAVVPPALKAARRAMRQGKLTQSEKLPMIAQEVENAMYPVSDWESGNVADRPINRLEKYVPNVIKQKLGEIGASPLPLTGKNESPVVPLKITNRQAKEHLLSIPLQELGTLDYPLTGGWRGDDTPSLKSVPYSVTQLGGPSNLVRLGREANEIIQALKKSKYASEPSGIFSKAEAVLREAIIEDLASRMAGIEELGKKMLMEKQFLPDSVSGSNIVDKLNKAKVGRRSFLGALGGALSSGKMFEKQVPKVLSRDEEILAMVKDALGGTDVSIVDVMPMYKYGETAASKYFIENHLPSMVQDQLDFLNKTKLPREHPEYKRYLDQNRLLEDYNKGELKELGKTYEISHKLPLDTVFVEDLPERDLQAGMKLLNSDVRRQILNMTHPVSKAHIDYTWQPLRNNWGDVFTHRDTVTKGNLKRLYDKMKWYGMHQRITNKGQK